MIYLNLLLSFFKIGLFSFGGGYAMIPLIQKEIASHGWITSQEFVNIIAIAEMTPGPIAVNAATFVGYKTAGIWGGAFATVGVALPSLILILIISHFFFKFQQHPFVKGMFYGIRPVVVALIIGASVFVAETSIFKGEITVMNVLHQPLHFIDPAALMITVASMVALYKYRLHPILAIVASGAVGVVLYYAGVV